MATSADRRPPQQPAGDQAEKPTQIPAHGWWQITRRAWAESSADHVSMLAGGVAFFAFLALVPALIAALTLYGIVADPAQVAQQVRDLTAGLPRDTQPLIAEQLNSIVAAGNQALGLGLIFSLLFALWSASSGTANLMQAINIAYDEDETRGFVKLRGSALLLTLGAIVFVLVTLTLVAVVPPLLDALQLGVVGWIVAQVVRWGLLVVAVVIALAVVYRTAADRDAPRLSWVSTGSIVATVLWIIATAGFSIYINNFGNYNKTYGALAGVIVLLLWLYLSSYIVLLGAEINAESERQTRMDTTRGEPSPMGERHATAADEVAPDRT